MGNSKKPAWKFVSSSSHAIGMCFESGGNSKTIKTDSLFTLEQTRVAYSKEASE